MKLIILLSLALLSETLSQDESSNIPIATTDDFHGEYMGDSEDEVWKQNIDDTLKDEVWKQDISDTLKDDDDHHLHPKLAITPILREYKKLSSTLEPSSIDAGLNNNDIDDSINVSDKNLKTFSLEGHQINQSGYEIGKNEKISMSIMKDSNTTNNSDRQTVDISVAEDVAIALKYNGNSWLFTLIFLTATLI